MTSTGKYAAFRSRLLAREQLIGTFIKTPTTHATEMFGIMGYDFVIFDCEHAPIGIEALDAMVLAARAYDIAAIVRVTSSEPGEILSALDVGASGVMVPHVWNPEIARSIAQACRYRGGRRGFAATSRAGDYGARSYSAHKDKADAEATCIAMIEDLEAVPHLDEIMAVPGIDAIFIGRGDLTAALDEQNMKSAATMEVVEKITAAARRAGMPMSVLCADRDDAANMHRLGASAFAVSSDHGFMRASAARALEQFRPPLG